jgi:hypothetical protein
MCGKNAQWTAPLLLSHHAEALRLTDAPVVVDHLVPFSANEAT